MPQLNLYLLDYPRVELDGASIRLRRRSALALLSYLACEQRDHSRDRLAALFWPDYRQQSARHNLNNSLSALRKALGDGWLESSRSSICLPAHPDLFIDVQLFGKLATTQCRHGGLPGQSVEVICRTCIAELEQATALYGDDFLAGFSMPHAADFDEWQRAQAAALHADMKAALERLGRDYASLGNWERAQASIRRLMRMEPLDERAHCLLTQLYLQRGERALAVSTMEEYTRLLAAEGLQPSEETWGLIQLLVQSPEHQQEHPSPPAFSELPPPPVSAVPTPQTFVTTTDYRLIGRAREWAFLRAQWQELTQPHFVCIAGEAGIGKSRLAEELLMHVARTGQRVARTRSHALEGRLAYGPVADWLRAEPLKSALAKLDPVWLTEVARILPELLIAHPNLPRPEPMTDSWQRKRLFEALLHAFTHNRDPLLLILDDLQWCDNDTLEWLQYLLERANHMLLLVGTARTGELADNHPLHRIRQQLTRLDRWSDIALSYLTPDATHALAAHVTERTLGTPQIDTNRAHTIFDDTAGNPLFVIESVRAAPNRTESIHAIAHNAARSGEPPHAMPPKMYGVIQSRLARLSLDATKVAQVAAIIGRAFSVELLAQAVEMSQEAVLVALDELWQQRIVREVDGVHFDFSHDRIRDVAYAEIRPVRRRLLHRKVVNALQSIHDADMLVRISGEIATHYEHAGNFRDAVDCYGRAARVADGVHAYKEKIRYLAKSTELIRQLPDRLSFVDEELSMLSEQRDAYIAVEGYASPGAEQVSLQMLELADCSQSQLARCSGLVGLRTVYQDRGEFQQALTCATEARELALKLGDEDLLGTSLTQLAGTYFHIGRLHDAWSCFEQTMALHNDKGLIRSVHTAWLLGYPEQAQQRISRAIAQMRIAGDPNNLCWALEFACDLDILRRDCTALKAHYQEVSALATKYELPFYEASNHFFEGFLLAHCGRVDDAKRTFQRGAAVKAELHTRQFEALRYYVITHSLLRGGRLPAALAYVEEAIATAERMNERFLYAEFFRLKGELLLRQHASVEDAEAVYQRSLHCAREQGAKLLELRTATSICRLWQRQDKRRAAHRLLANIYAQFTEGFQDKDLQEAKALMDELAHERRRVC